MHSLHRLVEESDIAGIREFLRSNREAIDAVDHANRTPLSLAVTNPSVAVEVVRLLLEYGANINPDRRQENESDRGILSHALRMGDPAKVAALIEAGANVKYQNSNGYDALIDAVHCRDVLRDPQLIA